jgi:serine/threonine protein kinase
MEIPGYTILDTLGQGGMATVYLAIQKSFEREVALKVMSSALSHTDPSFGERFTRESRIVSRLVHPNIVTVFDVGEFEGHHFLSMEYIPGQDLKQRRLELTLIERINVIKEVALALDFAGKKGYVHRDVKPENIMLHEEDGRAVLMDFGIAKIADTVSGMTQTGTAIGTPHYMSPEQAKGLSVDGRSDLYSLGVVLFLLLSGYVPFDAESAVSVGIKHVSEEIPQLPAHIGVFQNIIDKALAKDPEQRFQTGGELIAALSAITETRLQAIDDVAKELAQSCEASVDADALPPDAKTEVNTALPYQQGQDTSFNDQKIESQQGSFSTVLAHEIDAANTEPAKASQSSWGRLLLLSCLSVVALWGWLPQWQPLWVQQWLAENSADTMSFKAKVKDTKEVVGAEPHIQSTANTLKAKENTAPTDAEYDSLHDLRPVVSSAVFNGEAAQKTNTVFADLDDINAQKDGQTIDAKVDGPDKKSELAVVELSPIERERIALEQAEIERQRIEDEEKARLEQIELQREIARKAAQAERERLAAQALAEKLARVAAEKKAADEHFLSLRKKAESLMAAEQFVSGGDKSALAYYRQMLALRPGDKAAQQGLNQVSDALLSRSQKNRESGNFTEANIWLERAERHFSQRHDVIQERALLDGAIDAVTPKIPQVQVSASKLEFLSAQETEQLYGVDRTIYIGFRFADFQQQTSVVQAILFDGGHSVKIAQVPVIVSGKNGSAFFTIERAVHGFGSGGYHVDLILGDHLLASSVFKVEQ